MFLHARIRALALTPVAALACCGTLLPTRPAVGSALVVRIDEDNNRKHVKLRRGATLVVNLPVNRSTGYSWRVYGQFPSLLKPYGGPQYQKSAHAKQGQGARQVFRFGAGAVGITTLRMAYARSWQKNAKPEKVYAFTLHVAR